MTALPIDVASADQARQISAHLLLLAALRDHTNPHYTDFWVETAPEDLVRTLLGCAITVIDGGLLDELRARWDESSRMFKDLEQTIAAVEARLV